MAHSFRGNALTENVRLLWSHIFDFLFVYTDAEVDFLRRKGFTENYIVGMNNGLDQKNIDAAILMWPQTRLQEWRIARNLESHSLLLSCARLEPKNKFQQFVLALPAIVDRVPSLLWCVIGSGPEQAELESMVNTAGLAKHVRFVGELYKEAELAPWFLSSEIFVQPAAVGIGIMHAFGYGLPVVTHGNPERHGPEYAAFERELTGRNFHEGDIQHLSETVIKLLHDSDARSSMKSYVHKVAREKYNVDVMVERFVQIAKRASNA
jgi:glycosyltransferase involved in cell wall biosynthesis